MAHEFPDSTPRLDQMVEGMCEVTKEQFIAFVTLRDVHPSSDTASFKFRHHWSEWRLRDDRLIGISYSDSYGVEPTRFFRRAT